MQQLSLPTRLTLLVALAAIPGPIAAAIAAGGGAVASLVAVLAYLALIAAAWRLITLWCAPSDGVNPVAGDRRAQELQADLDERDHMLRELHHRVKNNLQMITSLLSLQADRIRSPRLRRIFADAQNRVIALSVLHRHLYDRSNWAQVDFQAFLRDLVRHLAVNQREAGHREAKIDIQAPVMPVGTDIAIPVGLIVTEAVSNALQHAFGETAQPQITIAVADHDGALQLTVDDNGVGIDPQLTLAEGGLGFTLLRGLAAQIGGEASVARRAEGGTRVLVRFSAPADAVSAA